MTGKTSENIDVLLFSRSSLVGEMITNLLGRYGHINVVSQASNKSELMDCLNDYNPQIVIIHDQFDKNLNTLEAVRLVNEMAEGTKPLILIREYDKEFELAALETGVRGFLPEKRVKSDIVRCITAMNDGQMWVRREVMGEFVTQLFVKIKRGDYLSPSVHYFTKRELDIIVLVNKGLKNKDIANKLFISEKTIKHILSKIFKKLQIKKRTDIKKYF